MRKINITLVMTLALLISSMTWAEKSTSKKSTVKKPIQFVDVQKQTIEFIGYYSSIKLTPEQEKIKKEALSSMPAPCCSNFTMATCCCPCNLAKAVWGLSNYLIAKQNYNAQQLKQTVTGWIQFTHKKGWAGDSCSSGRCGAPFHQDGCGGMKEGTVVF